MRARDIIDVCFFAARWWAAFERACARAPAPRERAERARWISPQLALTIAVAWCALSDVAHAESRVAPRWSWPDEPAGADCLTRSRLEQRIEEQLGGPLSEADFALSFEARIERTREGFRLVLVTEQHGQRGERTLEGSTCREVSDAAVLLIALSLDQSRAHQAERAPATPSSTTIGPSASAAASARASQAGVSPHQSPRERWGMHAAGLLDVGALPRAAVGFELGLSVSWARSRFFLTGLGLPPVHSERARDGSRVAVSLWTTRLGYCHTLLTAPAAAGTTTHAEGAAARLTMGACLGFELGAMLGQGVDLRAARSPSVVWAAGWFAVRAAFALSARWAVSVEPALALASNRGQFVSRDADGGINSEVFTPALLAKRLSLAVELSF